MTTRWHWQISAALWVLLCALVLGMILDHLLLALFLGMAGCLVWMLVREYRTARWIGSGMRSPPPVNDAIWMDLYDRVCSLRQRGRKRKRKLSRIIRQFRDASSALPGAVVLLSDADEVLWMNRAARAFLGLRSPQDLGLRITHLVRHPDFVRFLAERRYDRSVTFPGVMDKSCQIRVHINPYGKKRRLLLAEDITQVQRLEQMRRDFVANVSHELRTPLTVINGYLETFLDSDDERLLSWRQPMQTMHEQTGRMLHIIEDLLILARLETEGMPRVDTDVAAPRVLAAITQEAIALSGKRAHEIRLEADSSLWLRGCERELRSAFSNLVFNAVRYTPDGGHIRICWYEDAKGLHLEVRDDGEGVAPQHLARLTERFYRVDRGRHRASGGSGLGLAIVKHVMNRHDGQLRIDSQLGLGSTFSCDLPLERRLRKTLPTAANQSMTAFHGCEV